MMETEMAYERFEKTVVEKMDVCRVFFKQLADILSEEYEVVGSCNQDTSVYLVPKGTANQITYYGKPVGSFRISDHWNWLSSLKRCKDPNEVQCKSLDMPWCRKRSQERPESATKPVIGVQVAYYGPDKRYHCIYGEKFDRESQMWSWMNNSPELVADMVMRGRM